jgi:tetratricopeptide (TPR) repeat protein
MKNLYFIIALFLISCYSVFGQSSTPDSVLLSIDKLDNKDKIEYLFSFIKNRIMNNPSELLEVVNAYHLYALEEKDSVSLFQSYWWLRMIYKQEGDFVKALEYATESLTLAEQMNNKSYQSLCYQGIGAIYKKQNGKYDMAITYYNKYLDYCLQHNNYEGVVIAYSNIGDLFQLKGMLDTAIYYHTKSSQVCKQYVDEPSMLAATNTALGVDMVQAGKWTEAIDYFNIAEVIYKHLHSDYDMSVLYNQYGYLYANMQRYDSAIVYYQKGIRISEKMKLFPNLMVYYQAIANVYLNIDDYQNAYLYQNKYLKLNDSINTIQRQHIINKLQTEYDVEIMDKDIALLKASESEKNLMLRIRAIIIFSIIIVFGVVLVGFFVKFRKDKQLRITNKLLHQQKLELAKSETEKSIIQQNELKVQLEFKNKQLTTHALSMMQKNKLMQSLNEKLRDFNKTASEDQKSDIKQIRREINSFLKVEKDWELFKLYFEQVNEDFFDKIKLLNPELSSNDLRICALLKLNMNIKESASVLYLAPNSIKSARYRIRKKLNLKPEEDLVEFMQRV